MDLKKKIQHHYKNLSEWTPRMWLKTDTKKNTPQNFHKWCRSVKASGQDAFLPLLCLMRQTLIQIRWLWHQRGCHACLKRTSSKTTGIPGAFESFFTSKGAGKSDEGSTKITMRKGERRGVNTHCEVLHQLLLKRVLLCFYPYTLICQEEEVNRAMPSEG